MPKAVKFVKKSYKKKSLIKKPKVSSAIKLYVNRIIKKDEEVKINTNTFGTINILGYNGVAGTLTTFNVVDATNLAQGTGQAGRIGNAVNPASLKVRGFININSVLSTGIINAYFRVLILRLKASINSTQGTYGGLYQLGNTSTSPSGGLLDMMRPIDKDVYTVYYDKICLVGTSDAVTSNMAFNNSVGSKMFSIDMSKHLPSKLNYDDTTQTATNFAMYLAIVPCNANGQILTAGQIAGFSSTWEADFRYRDA